MSQDDDDDDDDMASPSASQQRSRIFSQLSRNHSNNGSTASSPQREAMHPDEATATATAMTMSSFQPEHESTQQFDTATQEQLPNLRSSAQRFAYYRAPEPDVHINTSFARDGFPDFTQQSPMSDHDDSMSMSMSIELGRGVKPNSARNASGRYNDLSDVSASPAFDVGHDSLYELTATPPVRSRALPKRLDRSEHNSLRKEASIRRAVTAPQPAEQQPTNTSDFSHTLDTVPPKTRSAAANQRRTLSDMHAKVNAESQSSFVGDDRPAATINAKNTRFSRSRHTSAPDHSIPTRFTTGQGLNAANETPQRRPQPVNPNFTGNQTQQSFMLPDLPNITELVSGVRKDGTPVFSRSVKSPSRFVSGPYNNDPNTETVTYAKLHSIPLPDDEKAIFASLQLLQDKVAHLELEKSEAVKRMDEYENEVVHLRSRVQIEQKLRRPDSALGSDEESSAQDKWRLERTKLQSTVKILHDRLAKADRKIAVSDIAVKHVTKERDGLVTQLGVAYYNSEELKAENEQLRSDNDTALQANGKLQAETETLRQDNQNLCAKMARIKAQIEDETQQWTRRETDLKRKIERRDTSIRGLQDLTRTIPELKNILPEPTMPLSRKPSSSRETQRERGPAEAKRRPSAGRVTMDTRNNIMDQIEAQIRDTRAEASREAGRRTSSKDRRQRRQTAAQVQDRDSDVESTTDLDFSKLSRSRPLQHPRQSALDEDDSRDITYLSFLDPDELANLRKRLEAERRASRNGRAASAPLVGERQGNEPTITGIPRKSSLKDLTGFAKGRAEDTGRLSIGAPSDDDLTGPSKNVRIQSPNTSDAISYEGPREATETSILSNASRRRQRSKSIEEMTSAFILPDITLHVRGDDIASNAAMACDKTVAHDKAGCTVCLTKNGERQEDIRVPTPVPVSDREIDETNATIRPSQPPTIALATVLKQLEDEVAHLKMQLATCEKAYNAHDPALGQRKRKAVKTKMDTLIDEIEHRSDQIYALYDVLEGQKQAKAGAEAAGATHEMNDDEVEETLQSLGIDPSELTQRAAKMNDKSKSKSERNDATAATSTTGSKKNTPYAAFGARDGLFDSDDDLPWEGISDESDSESLRFGLPKRRSVGA